MVTPYLQALIRRFLEWMPSNGSSNELPIKMALGSSRSRPVNHTDVKLLVVSLIAIFGVPPIARN